MRQKKENPTTKSLECSSSINADEEETKDLSVRYYETYGNYIPPLKECRRERYERRKVKSLEPKND